MNCKERRERCEWGKRRNFPFATVYIAICMIMKTKESGGGGWEKERRRETWQGKRDRIEGEKEREISTWGREWREIRADFKAMRASSFWSEKRRFIVPKFSLRENGFLKKYSLDIIKKLQPNTFPIFLFCENEKMFPHNDAKQALICQKWAQEQAHRWPAH